MAALFARTSFKEDSQRLEGLVGYAYIRNEYKDYMGSGQTFRTTDEVALGAGRYLYRVKGPWFLGAEAAFGNYSVEAETDLQNKVLNMLGLAGFQMGSAGPVLMHDSRDNQDMPVRGWYTNLNALANRTWLGSQDDFDTVRLEFKAFVPHGKAHVFAVRENNQWTHDAPTSAESTVEVRGYKMEQYPREAHGVDRGGGTAALLEALGRDDLRWGRVPLRERKAVCGERRVVSVRRGWHPVHREARGPHAARFRVRARQLEQLWDLPEVRLRVVRR